MIKTFCDQCGKEMTDRNGPYGIDINQSFRYQILLADEVKRLRDIAETFDANKYRIDEAVANAYNKTCLLLLETKRNLPVGTAPKGRWKTALYSSGYWWIKKSHAEAELTAAQAERDKAVREERESCATMIELEAATPQQSERAMGLRLRQIADHIRQRKTS